MLNGEKEDDYVGHFCHAFQEGDSSVHEELGLPHPLFSWQFLCLI